jgi:hypothetical protein
VKPGNKIIGLAIGQRSFLLAEVAPRAGRNTVQHFAEFIFPEGLTLSTPEPLGAALGQFLKSRRFSTRDVVFGLPAKRLITRSKEIPPATPGVAASTLRLQAEGEFSSELDNLVMDFAGTPSTVEATKVLLIATNRESIEQCETIARAAGLRVVGVTSTTTALGRATSRLPGGDGWVLNLGEAGAEVVVQHGQDPAHLRHLNVADSASPESVGALAGEIRRMMASIPRNGTPMTLAMWKSPSNGQGLPGNLLEQRLSIPVTTPELRTIVATDNPEAEAYAPAVALALSALEPAGLPVDFLHSRLAPPPPPKISRRKLAAYLITILAVLLFAGAFLQISARSRDLETLTEANRKNVDLVKTITAEQKRLEDAKKWMPKGPHFVNVLRDVTILFPRRSNTIWVDRLNNLRDATGWEVDGKTTNERFARELLNAMLDRSDKFSGAKLTSMTKDPTGDLYSFRLQFTYVDPNVPPTPEKKP